MQWAEKNTDGLKRSQTALTTADRTAHTEQTQVTELDRQSDDNNLVGAPGPLNGMVIIYLNAAMSSVRVINFTCGPS